MRVLALNLKIFLTILVAFAGLSQARAQDILSIKQSSSKYQSGEDLCPEPLKIKGQWIKTGEFKDRAVYVFAHFVNDYDPERPTILYFTGGPGGNSHQLENQGKIASVQGYNLLAFDQRGIACSKPSEEEIYLDPDFYSSSHTVDDAVAILKHHNLKSVVVWGASYGTVPVTIMASKYPQYISSVVLEGVFYQFLNTQKMTEIVEEFWSRLSDEVRGKIEEFHQQESKNADLPNPIFSVLRDLSLSYGKTAQDLFINHLNEMGDSLIVRYDFLSLWRQKEFPNTLKKTLSSILNNKDVDVFVNQTLLMKELGRCTKDFNAVEFKVESGRLIELKQTHGDHEIACPDLAAKSYIQAHQLQELTREFWTPENYVIMYERDISLLHFNEQIYSFGDVPPVFAPKDHSFSTPVYYFNGTYDLATPLDLAQRHFKEVNMKTSVSYFLEFDLLGHHPIVEAYEVGAREDHLCMNDLLKSVFAGERLYGEQESCFSGFRFKLKMH